MFYKRRVLLLMVVGLFCLLHGALWAEATSPERVQKAVKGWLKQGNRRLGTLLGDKVKAIQAHKDNADTVIYYVVYLDPTGYLIVSADDEIEPIIAFTSSSAYDPAPSNPMGALVEADMKNRIATVRKKQKNVAVTQTATSKWRELEQQAESSSTKGLLPKAGPLLTSTWDQSDVAGQACYNYYTPPGPDSSTNYPCGCVATAMAQIMYYHKYPTNGVGTTLKGSYQINDGGLTQHPYLGGDGNGGPYSWNDMPENPEAVPLSDTQRRAIGALCFDAGISVGMNYKADASGIPPTTMNVVADALMNVFQYSSALYCGLSTTINETDIIKIDPDIYDKVNLNLDGGYPVLLGIQGINVTTGKTAGHAIVCDGYDDNLSTPCHHLNMGWGGNYDTWYNLPKINTGNGNFNVVCGCVYNIFPKPFVVSSSATATPNPAHIEQNIYFSCAPGRIASFVWNFGDGTTSTEATPTHAYTTAGTYNVTCVITDKKSGQTCNDSVIVKVLKSVPLSSARIELKFHPKSDMLVLAGAVPAPQNFTPAGKQFSISIGDYQSEFTLNMKFRSISGTDSLKLIGRRQVGSFGDAQPLRFLYKVSKQDLFSKLARYGFVNDNVSAKTIMLPVIVTMDNDSYLSTLLVRYTAKKDKKGIAKMSATFTK